MRRVRSLWPWLALSDPAWLALLVVILVAGNRSVGSGAAPPSASGLVLLVPTLGWTASALIVGVAAAAFATGPVRYLAAAAAVLGGSLLAVSIGAALTPVGTALFVAAPLGLLGLSLHLLLVNPRPGGSPSPSPGLRLSGVLGGVLGLLGSLLLLAGLASAADFRGRGGPVLAYLIAGLGLLLLVPGVLLRSLWSFWLGTWIMRRRGGN